MMAEKKYLNQADADVYIESLSEKKVIVTDKGRVMTIKEYVDQEIAKVKKLIP
jgi:hypothetical protein